MRAQALRAVRLRVVHPQRSESRWLLDVEGGMLTVTEPLTMRKLTVTPEQTERVRRACSGAIIGATK